MSQLVPPTQSTRRVLILGTSILEEGIAHILKIVNGLQVSTEKYTSDDSFLNNIKLYQPDIILLNETALLNSAHLLDILFSIPAQTCRRVIVVRLDSKIIDVYDYIFQSFSRYGYKGDQFIVTKHDDLIAHCLDE